MSSRQSEATADTNHAAHAAHAARVAHATHAARPRFPRPPVGRAARRVVLAPVAVRREAERVLLVDERVDVTGRHERGEPAVRGGGGCWNVCVCVCGEHTCSGWLFNALGVFYFLRSGGAGDGTCVVGCER